MRSSVAALDLAERLEAGLGPSVARVANLLHDAMPASASRAEGAAELSLNANFSAIIAELREPRPAAARDLPPVAACWPRALADLGCAEDCVIQGYLVCAEVWWRQFVLPELFAVCAGVPEPDRLSMVQHASDTVFGYVRVVGAQAVGEYRGALGSTASRSTDAGSLLDYLLDTADRTELGALASERLSPLASTRQGNSELIRTIVQWFDSLCCTVTTARRLGIHRNTLLYRLRKIEHLLGRSLDKDRFELELVLRIVQRLNNPSRSKVG